ncbi:MAG: DUF4367 domain-containing protein, partial [Bacillota bacterium]|nr:DUF4367 domain-containing protein [Bacillota bacterium]
YQETGPALGELTTDYVGHGLFIVVRQSNSAYFGSRYGHTIETMVRVSPVAVRGVEATLLERDTDGWVSLSWQDEGIYYAISGRMSPEQVRQMAESLQEA